MTPAPAGVDIEAAFEEVERIALGLERELSHAQRRTFELAEQVTAARSETDEVRQLLRRVVERVNPAMLETATLPHDELWSAVVVELNRGGANG